MIRKQPIVIDSYLKLKLRPSTLEQSECGIVFQLQYYTLKSEEQVMVPNSELDRQIFREYRFLARNTSRVSKAVFRAANEMQGKGTSFPQRIKTGDQGGNRPGIKGSSPHAIRARASQTYSLLNTRLKSLEWKVRQSESFQAVFSAPIQMFPPPGFASWFPGGANFHFGHDPADFHFLFNGCIWISDVCISSEDLLNAIAAKSMRAEKRLQRGNAGGPQPTDRHISQAVRIEVWRRDGGKCVRCSSRNRIEFDHIIPVIEGGGSTARNVELLCEACNRAKSSRVDG
jgi:hypothetical protein